MRGMTWMMVAAVLLAVTLPGTAQAADVWVNARRIIYLYPNGDGLVFRLDGARVNTTSPCESNRMIFNKTLANYETIVATLTTAFAMGLLVDVNYDDATTGQCDTVANRMVAYR